MKTKLSLLFIFLLAIGGSMSAQLVLPICSVNLPCPGFPLGSVQAPIDQNGWRNFKVTLTANVTPFSFVGIPPSPAQAAVNIIFTQDVVGGRTVTFAAGISSSCTITTAANSTTLCQFEYDGTAATWFSISGGGGGAAGANVNSFYVQKAACGGLTNCTQIKADGRYVIDATSNSSTTITCPNNDCNFTQGDVGKTVWGTTQGTGAGIGFLIYTTYVCPVTTISTVNSAQSITVGVACTANGTANVALYWATDDGTALASLDAAVGCSTVVLPDPGVNGNYILTSQPFLVNPPAASVCLQQLTTSVGNPAPALTGTGWGSPQSTIMIHPNFNWAACKAITGASNPVCIGGTARSISNLMIIGSGLTSASNSTGCSGAANKIVLSGSPTATIIYGVDMAGICPGASGLRGIEVNAFDEIFAEGGVQEVGTVACAAHGNNVKGILFQANDCHNVNVSGANGLVVDATTQMTDIGSFPIQSALVNGYLIARGTHFIAGTGSTTAVSVGGSATVQHYGDFIGVDTDGVSTVIGEVVSQGGTSYFTATTVTATATSISNNGTVISMGGNKLNALAIGTNTGVWLGSGVLVGTCSGTATSSSTLGLFRLGQYTTPNCTSTTVNVGVGLQTLPLSGSIFLMNVQAGTGCAAANTCVFTVMKTHNGTTAATTITCSLTGGASSCQDSGSHFDIGAAGDSYSIQFTTGAAETLANVTATVVAW